MSVFYCPCVLCYKQPPFLAPCCPLLLPSLLLLLMAEPWAAMSLKGLTPRFATFLLRNFTCVRKVLDSLAVDSFSCSTSAMASAIRSSLRKWTFFFLKRFTWWVSLPNSGLVNAYLSLCWMHIYIHILRLEF